MHNYLYDDRVRGERRREEGGTSSHQSASVQSHEEVGSVVVRESTDFERNAAYTLGAPLRRDAEKVLERLDLSRGEAEIEKRRSNAGRRAIGVGGRGAMLNVAESEVGRKGSRTGRKRKACSRNF